MCDKTNVTIYTDGSAPENSKGHGRGGWCAILVSGEHEKVLSGREDDTTNNRQELRAVIEGLNALKFPCCVTITTDSEYVKNGVTEWSIKWKRNGWKNAAGKPVKNQDLWRELDKALSRHTVSWEWVRGHNGHPQNERCDSEARRQADLNKQ